MVWDLSSQCNGRHTSCFKRPSVGANARVQEDCKVKCCFLNHQSGQWRCGSLSTLGGSESIDEELSYRRWGKSFILDDYLKDGGWRPMEGFLSPDYNILVGTWCAIDCHIHRTFWDPRRSQALEWSGSGTIKGLFQLGLRGPRGHSKKSNCGKRSDQYTEAAYFVLVGTR